MNRIMMASLVVVATELGGCTSVMGPTPAPSCDGGTRRPLNRSMWDWEATRPGAPVASAITPVPVEGSASASGHPDLRKGGPVAPERIGEAHQQHLPRFDVAASLRACTGGFGHG